MNLNIPQSLLALIAAPARCRLVPVLALALVPVLAPQAAPAPMAANSSATATETSVQTVKELPLPAALRSPMAANSAALALTAEAETQQTDILASLSAKSLRVRQISPRVWKRPLPTDSVSRMLQSLLEECIRYSLTTWRCEVKHFDRADSAALPYYPLAGRQEKIVRPLSHEAFLLALALRWGLCNESITGQSEAETLKFATKLIASICHAHKACTPSSPKSWGGQWQSALWAAQVAEAAWFLWDKLGTDAQRDVLRMVIYEADRFNHYRVPYYRDRDGHILFPGDTKAEENAWNSNILSVACLMLPHHPHQQLWDFKNRELQISAYSRPSDLVKKEKIDGLRLDTLLKGSNMNEDGTVINHNRLHPDYMVAFMHNATNAWLYRMAAQRPLESSTFNGWVVYSCLTSQPFGPDCRTIYTRDSLGRATSEMYFPEGNDWGTGRQANYFLMDVLAHCFGMDKQASALSPSAPAAKDGKPSTAAPQQPTVTAYDWALSRCNTMVQKMKQSATGRYFSSKSENSFDSAEEFFAAQLAWAYLGLWLQ